MSKPRNTQTQHPWYIQTADYKKGNGNGEPMGRAISAEGQEGILGKLRQLLPWARKIS
jgi:hypothetical protein